MLSWWCFGFQSSSNHPMLLHFFFSLTETEIDRANKKDKGQMTKEFKD